MKKIWKYKLEITDNVVLEMPRNAEILTVQMQGETPMIWALVDTENNIEKRSFKIIGTGNPVPDLARHLSRKYINTFQMMEGRLVFHLFEIFE
jgi:hypothetical protein